MSLETPQVDFQISMGLITFFCQFLVLRCFVRKEKARHSTSVSCSRAEVAATARTKQTPAAEAAQQQQ